MTPVILIALALLAAAVLVSGARKRAARVKAAAALTKARAARRSRVPNVSNNLKGVGATQTIEPYRPNGDGGSEADERAA